MTRIAAAVCIGLVCAACAASLAFASAGERQAGAAAGAQLGISCSALQPSAHDPGDHKRSVEVGVEAGVVECVSSEYAHTPAAELEVTQAPVHGTTQVVTDTHPAGWLRSRVMYTGASLGDDQLTVRATNPSTGAYADFVARPKVVPVWRGPIGCMRLAERALAACRAYESRRAKAQKLLYAHCDSFEPDRVLHNPPLKARVIKQQRAYIKRARQAEMILSRLRATGERFDSVAFEWDWLFATAASTQPTHPRNAFKTVTRMMNDVITRLYPPVSVFQRLGYRNPPTGVMGESRSGYGSDAILATVLYGGADRRTCGAARQIMGPSVRFYRAYLASP
jgi:hypothetical protein